MFLYSYHALVLHLYLCNHLRIYWITGDQMTSSSRQLYIMFEWTSVWMNECMFCLYVHVCLYVCMSEWVSVLLVFLYVCMYIMYVCYDLNTHFAKVMAITVHVCMMCVFAYFLYQICFLHIVAWFSHPSCCIRPSHTTIFGKRQDSRNPCVEPERRNRL